MQNNFIERGVNMQYKLVKIRKESGITQKEMSDIIGIAEGSYRMKERDKRQFNLDEMFIIANYFKLSISDIFTKRSSRLENEVG